MADDWQNETVDQIRDRLRRVWGDYLLTIIIINPINLRLVRLVGRTSLKPIHLTIIAFGITVLAAICFASLSWILQATGGGLLLFAFLLDCLDGDLARLKDMGTPLGAMLDPIFDRLGEISVIVGASICGWRTTGEPLWLLSGVILTGISQVYFYITDFMLNKVQKKIGKVDNSHPLKIFGTKVRFGTIEPFIWGMSFLGFSGNVYLGIPIFLFMFAACNIIQLSRLIRLARSLSNLKSDKFGSHVW